MAQIERDPVFSALTRPQMFAGVTYNWFILNAIVTAEIFLVTKSFWAFAGAMVMHLVGVIAARDEPRFLDLWITRMSRSPRVANFSFWRCNSYTP
jgi:type IV secretion system protein VirB3